MLQVMERREAAKKLRVSVSTVSKWKDGRGRPGTKKLAKRLTKESAKVRKKLQGQGKSKSQKFKTPNLKVIIPAQRQTRIDPKDKKGKRRVPSNTVSFSVAKTRLVDMADLIQYYSRKGVAFRVVYELPAGKTDYNKQKYKDKRHVSTTWEYIGQSRFQTREGIFEFLEELQRIGKLLYIVFTDRGYK